jgi:hypothetical protein
MVDPISATIGVGACLLALLAAYGLYAAGQRPDHMVDMNEVASYYRHASAQEALSEEVNQDGE